MVNAKTFLEKRYNEELELEDAVHTAILTLKVRWWEGAAVSRRISLASAMLTPRHNMPLRYRHAGGL
jgi:20S proteasome subunit alpha 2